MPPAIILFILRFIYCKYCSRYTTPPSMICEDSIYCRTCAAKICYDCSLVMECTLLQDLKEFFEEWNSKIEDPDQKYDFVDGFVKLDFCTRMTFLMCSECELIRHNCLKAARGKLGDDASKYPRSMNPDLVKQQFLCFVLYPN